MTREIRDKWICLAVFDKKKNHNFISTIDITTYFNRTNVKLGLSMI